MDSEVLENNTEMFLKSQVSISGLRKNEFESKNSATNYVVNQSFENSTAATSGLHGNVSLMEVLHKLITVLQGENSEKSLQTSKSEKSNKKNGENKRAQDLKTMGIKVSECEYISLAEFQDDFDHIMRTAVISSSPNDILYIGAMRLWKLGTRLINSQYNRLNIDERTKNEGDARGKPRSSMTSEAADAEKVAIVPSYSLISENQSLKSIGKLRSQVINEQKPENEIVDETSVFGSFAPTQDSSEKIVYRRKKRRLQIDAGSDELVENDLEAVLSGFEKIRPKINDNDALVKRMRSMESDGFSVQEMFEKIFFTDTYVESKRSTYNGNLNSRTESSQMDNNQILNHNDELIKILSSLQTRRLLKGEHEPSNFEIEIAKNLTESIAKLASDISPKRLIPTKKHFLTAIQNSSTSKRTDPQYQGTIEKKIATHNSMDTNLQRNLIPNQDLQPNPYMWPPNLAPTTHQLSNGSPSLVGPSGIRPVGYQTPGFNMNHFSGSGPMHLMQLLPPSFNGQFPITQPYGMTARPVPSRWK
ncbi:hypothetical protein HK096_003992 [Nowakowskiella sp. JEL0078]|nr:hypothetical protein HK096_003992 [Nowakowskiella sp. JEL0078]